MLTMLNTVEMDRNVDVERMLLDYGSGSDVFSRPFSCRGHHERYIVVGIGREKGERR
jgi:hypothetical protein